jgi:predicted Rdx family selenoprotein
MRYVWVLVLASLVGSSAAWGLSDASIQAQDRRYAVQFPPGYVLELLTDGLKGPRLITFAPGGELLVGSRSGRRIRDRKFNGGCPGSEVLEVKIRERSGVIRAKNRWVGLGKRLSEGP